MIFPNPTNAKFSISFDDHVKPDKILIYNYMGIKVLEIDPQGMESPVEIDLSKYTWGFYFVRTTINNKIITNKVELIN